MYHFVSWSTKTTPPPPWPLIRTSYERLPLNLQLHVLRQRLKIERFSNAKWFFIWFCRTECHFFPMTSHQSWALNGFFWKSCGFLTLEASQVVEKKTRLRLGFVVIVFISFFIIASLNRSRSIHTSEKYHLRKHIYPFKTYITSWGTDS